MNSEGNAPLDPSSSAAAEPVIVAAVQPPQFDWHYWLHRLLACNPFFLCSAALLLWGVNRLSLDPGFLAEETSNLIFNFSALHFYECLVIGTALLLARRKIWYDSALLVVMENGLVLVPFLLITHGIVVGRPLALTLAVTGLILIGLRLGAVRKWHPTFNLPRRLLLLGLPVLALNTALPFWFYPWVVADMDRWIFPNQVLWITVLPVLVVSANLLRDPKRYGGLNHERPWLPLLIFGLWVGATGVHVWSVGYICMTPFTYAYTGPVLLAAAWTAWSRRRHFVENPPAHLELVLLSLTAVVPLVAFSSPLMFEALVACNALLHAVLRRHSTGHVRRFTGILLFLTPALLTAGLPLEWLPAGSQITREKLVAGAFCATAITVAVRYRWMPFAFIGAFAAMIVTTALPDGIQSGAMMQAGLLFILLHSFFWADAPAARKIRGSVAAVWVIHSAGLVHTAGTQPDLVITAIGVSTLAITALYRKLAHKWPSWVLMTSSIAVSLCAPVDWLLRNGTAGVLALVGSLALFGIGTVAAILRQRCSKSS